MTAEIINLNKVRKARERAQKEKIAEENRLKYGRSAIERDLVNAEKRKGDADLDGAKREMDRHDPRRLDDNHDDLDPGNVS